MVEENKNVAAQQGDLEQAQAPKDKRLDRLTEPQLRLREIALIKLRAMCAQEIMGLIEPNGRIQLLKVPTMEKALSISHNKLIKILRLCPLSPHFGASKEALSKSTVSCREARRLVSQLSVKWQFEVALPSVDELSNEQSSRSSQKVKEFGSGGL